MQNHSVKRTLHAKLNDFYIPSAWTYDSVSNIDYKINQNTICFRNLCTGAAIFLRQAYSASTIKLTWIRHAGRSIDQCYIALHRILIVSFHYFGDMT